MSARTKDFIAFPSALDQFVMYSADNDDGLKWHFYNLDTTSSFGIEFIDDVLVKDYGSADLRIIYVSYVYVLPFVEVGIPDVIYKCDTIKTPN